MKCCFWLNLSFDLTIHKSCLNFWLKSEIRLKSETAPHPRCITSTTAVADLTIGQWCEIVFLEQVSNLIRFPASFNSDWCFDTQHLANRCQTPPSPPPPPPPPPPHTHTPPPHTHTHTHTSHCVYINISCHSNVFKVRQFKLILWYSLWNISCAACQQLSKPSKLQRISHKQSNPCARRPMSCYKSIFYLPLLGPRRQIYAIHSACTLSFELYFRQDMRWMK